MKYMKIPVLCLAGFHKWKFSQNKRECIHCELLQIHENGTWEWTVYHDEKIKLKGAK